MLGSVRVGVSIVVIVVVKRNVVIVIVLGRAFHFARGAAGTAEICRGPIPLFVGDGTAAPHFGAAQDARGTFRESVAPRPLGSCCRQK